MSKYLILLNVLDRIREEARGARFEPTYLPAIGDVDAINQSRARAFIHLFLKVGFGLLDFSERERFVTDGSYDGGIDAYFIQTESRTVFFIQSKFRTTETNFQSKKIMLDEILVMDINRILDGESHDEAGNAYNGKIRQLQREVSQIEDIARYKYKVVLLASLSDGWTDTKLRQLTGGYPVQVIDHERCYSNLVFPVVTGTFFNASDLNINIDLSNKNAGAKISYTVSTKYTDCDITALFVPTLEIAKIMLKYKNSILRFNPRSYLELAGQNVNAAIRETILNRDTNEFALFNNGITMLSDETHINERIGQKNKAQLTLRNPQIINGGQTAYTLSRIFEERSSAESEELFKEKEVLLKVITLVDTETRAATTDQKIDLIDQISTATNQQTPVINADRRSNEKVYITIQTALFERYGLLYERKRGEFADGLNKHYVKPPQVMERNLFFRLFHAVQGRISDAVLKKQFVRFKNSEMTIADVNLMDKVYFAFLCHGRLTSTPSIGRKDREREVYAKLFVLTLKYGNVAVEEFQGTVDSVLPTFEVEWQSFIDYAANLDENRQFLKMVTDRFTDQKVLVFGISRWLKSKHLVRNARAFFLGLPNRATGPGAIP